MHSLDQLSAYDYTLPKELIATEPLPERDAGRLLVLYRKTGTVGHHAIRDLPELLAANDCLVFNNTRVLPARLLGTRTATGGKWEGLYLMTNAQGYWKLIGQTRGYLKQDESVLVRSNKGEELFLRLMGREDDGIFLFLPGRQGTALDLLSQFIECIPNGADCQLKRYNTLKRLEVGEVASWRSVQQVCEHWSRRRC